MRIFIVTTCIYIHSHTHGRGHCSSSGEKNRRKYHKNVVHCAVLKSRIRFGWLNAMRAYHSCDGIMIFSVSKLRRISRIPERASRRRPNRFVREMSPNYVDEAKTYTTTVRSNRFTFLESHCKVEQFDWILRDACRLPVNGLFMENVLHQQCISVFWVGEHGRIYQYYAMRIYNNYLNVIVHHIENDALPFCWAPVHRLCAEELSAKW